MIRTATWVMSALALVLAGCGGGDGNDPSGLPAGAPRPAQTFSAGVKAFERAAANPACAALEPLVHSQSRQTAPGEPLSAEECRVLRQKFQRSLAGFKPGESKEFGTAGLVDGKAVGQQQSVVLVLDTDRRWKFAFAIPASPQVGSKPGSSDSFGRSASRFVDAVRRRDCGALVAVTSVSSPSFQGAGGNRRRLCRASLNPAAPITFVAQIRQNPTAKPRSMGSTADFGFYGIGLKSGRYDTIVMITQPRDAPPAQLAGKARYAFFELYNARAPRS